MQKFAHAPSNSLILHPVPSSPHRGDGKSRSSKFRHLSRRRLGEWSRFDYDVDAGVLVFSDDRKPKVVADIQVVGTTSFKAGDWLWAWANSHWPESRTTDAKAVRDFGERHGVRELTRESLEDKNLNALGWGLTAVAARVTDALGAYRPPRNVGGGLYLLYKRVGWAS